MKKLCILLCLIFATISANAEQITVQIEGIFDDVSDVFGILPVTINLNDPFVGTYTYDTDQTPLTHIPDQSSYLYSTLPYGMRIEINGMIMETDPTDPDLLIQIADDKGSQDFYIVATRSVAPLSSGTEVEDIKWQLDDPTMNALSSHDISSIPPILADWPNINLTVFGSKYNADTSITEYFDLHGIVTSATVVQTTVPEPLSIILLLLTCLVGWIRKHLGSLL